MRGGKRVGSGRKPASEQKVVVSFRLSAGARDRVKELRRKGVNINADVESLINSY